MTIGLVLTIVLAVLTATGTFDLSLFQILLPALIELVLTCLLFVVFAASGRALWKKESRRTTPGRHGNAGRRF